MTDHQCPYVGGLATCPDHPKWHVIGVPGHSHHYWLTYAPNGIRHEAGFGTWREAFDYAHTRATEA